MSKLGSQKDYWNERVEKVRGNYGPGLVLSPEEIAFQRSHIRANGETLVLGATPSLCSVALDVSRSVTAVDFAEKVIKNARQVMTHSRSNEVQFVHMDWIGYFEQEPARFDTIATDGGLLCLQLPDWKRLAGHIRTHLQPGGRFIAKAYVHVPERPDVSKNPNLARFMTIPTSGDKDWEVTPTHGDYADFDVRYTLPPKEVVLQTLGGLALVDEMVPDYEEGRRFVSYAWQNA